MKSILLSCENKEETRITHVVASDVMPPLVAPQLDENVPRKAAGNTPKSNLLGNPLKENSDKLQKLFEGLHLEGIESWTKQQQSVH